MLFSVVTVCLNAESTIGRCARSIVAQHDDNGMPYEDFEYLVIDGVSSDRTVGIVQQEASCLGERLRVVSEKDAGIYDAMNKGVSMARGTYIAFINADDWLESDALYKVGKAIEKASGSGHVPDAVGGALRVHAAGGETHLLSPEPAQLGRRYPLRMAAGHQATIVRTTVMREIAGFRPQFRIAADYDLYLRMRDAGATWAFTDDVLANFTLGGASYGALPTARDYRAVRLANGFPHWFAWTQYVRNVAGSLLARRGAGRD